jgi:uncharacterized protein (DUF1810 family)
MPVDIFIQESENLYKWCQEDEEALVKADLDWNLVEEMPVRAGALREAESRWFLHRFQREEARIEWIKRSPEAYDLRDRLLHAYAFAYRKHADLSVRVSAIREGATHVDMIQDLNNLAVIGRENPAPLEKIHFDMALVEKAAATADEMGALYAASVANGEDSEALKIRNKAYTCLKQAVDEVRETGQFVFWRDKKRVKGYTSRYFRRKYNARKNGNNEPDSPDEECA